MQCLDFESRLQNVLDARQAPQSDAAINRHAAECADCRQLLAATLAVVEYAAAMPAACPAGLTRQVLAQMQPRRRVLPMRWAIPLAAAAALAGILPLWSWLFREDRSAENQITATHGQVQPAQVPLATGESARPAQPAKSEIASADSWSLVPKFSDFGARTQDELKVGFNGVGDDVREGLAPVTHSTTGALESLWQALSPTEDNRS